MLKRYDPAQPPTLITNDLYLAAFLRCAGCELHHVESNGRRRMSFVFVGDRVRELREAYRTGPVKLDMRSFRDSLTHMRRLMDTHRVDAEQRSVPHAQAGCLQAESHPRRAALQR